MTSIAFRIAACGLPLPVVVAGASLLLAVQLGEAAAPRISRVDPVVAKPGDAITISGEHFSAVPGDNTVFFGGVRAPVTAATANELSVTVPSGATFARVTVTVEGLTAAAPQPFLPTFPGDLSPIGVNTFAPGFNLPAGDGPSPIVLADFDNDGKPDIAVGNGYGNTLRLYRNIGANGPVSADSFAAPVDFPSPPGSASNPYKMTAADLDGDGRLDLLASGVNSDKLVVWRNTSSPGSLSTNSFATPFLLQTGLDSRFAKAADLDGDGRPDIVTADYGSSTISIIKNIGGAVFGPDCFAGRVDLKTATGPYELDLGDLDGDGRPDIAVATYASAISLFRNVATNSVLDTNSFAARVDLAAVAESGTIVIGDVDGDRKPDLVTGAIHPLKISVYRNLSSPGALGTDAFALPVDFSTENWVHTVALGDFDGDARPDIGCTGELPSHFSVFQNLSAPGAFDAGSLAARVDFGTGWNAWGLGVGDLDADGRPEAVFANAYDDTITIYRNTSPLAGPPVILSQPADLTAGVGENASFVVQAAGSPDLAYQWWKNAAPLEASTNRTLTLLAVQFSDAGDYFVVVTNTYGSLTSAVAVLTVSNLAPYIITQPLSRTVMRNGTAEFSVIAGGNRPLSYQWRFGDTDLPGATASTLTITNAQLENVGTYSVLVSNSLGSILSSNASLSVVVPPAYISTPNTNAPSGWPITLPVLLAANGNENAVSFSLNFGGQSRTPLLRFLSATAAPGTSGASLILNTNLLPTGLLGIAVALPANATFAPGTQVVATVTCDTDALASQQTVSPFLSFIDVPIPRQVTDTRAQSLPAQFSAGRIVLLPSDLEGDTSPRPGGNRSLTLNDWVQAGRFAAGLDIPEPGTEFQRADCAPREIRGDGYIKVTDWVQTGRYFGKLDPFTAMGGPSSAAPGKVAFKDDPLRGPGTRQVKAGDASSFQGLTVEIPLLLDSQGDENALGFSLSFDASRLQFTSAVAGSGAANAVLNLNPGQPGKLGVALALPTGAVFPAGDREIARVSFAVVSAGAADVPLGFADSPVLRAVSDAFASELPADYITGVVQVLSPPELRIQLAGSEAVLAWPAWARDFQPQIAVEAGSPGVTWTNLSGPALTNGNELELRIPLEGQARYFRLRHP